MHPAIICVKFCWWICVLFVDPNQRARELQETTKLVIIKFWKLSDVVHHNSVRSYQWIMLEVLDFSPCYCAKLMLFVILAFDDHVEWRCKLSEISAITFSQKSRSLLMHEKFNQQMSAFCWLIHDSEEQMPLANYLRLFFYGFYGPETIELDFRIWELRFWL